MTDRESIRDMAARHGIDPAKVGGEDMDATTGKPFAADADTPISDAAREARRLLMLPALVDNTRYTTRCETIIQQAIDTVAAEKDAEIKRLKRQVAEARKAAMLEAASKFQAAANQSREKIGGVNGDFIGDVGEIIANGLRRMAEADNAGGNHRPPWLQRMVDNARTAEAETPKPATPPTATPADTAWPNDYICRGCAEDRGGKWGHVATWHDGVCGYCGQHLALANIGDWDWPDGVSRGMRD